MERISETNFSLNCRGNLIDVNKPKIMGILNITPDSFSDGGRFNTLSAALKQTEKMLLEGAEIIDIGAQSTRPAAEFLSAETEIARLGNIISEIKKEFPQALVSLDTFYAETVEFGFNEGIDIINDISGGQYDGAMFETAAKTGLPYILMHSNPTYNDMHQKVHYEDITVTLNYFFSEKILALKAAGVKDIILDPGFGFGKTVQDQMKLLNEIKYIGFTEYPLLIGISRKSFIYKPLDKKPTDIVDEMQKIHLEVLKQGAKILRVHDVAEARETIGVFLAKN